MKPGWAGTSLFLLSVLGHRGLLNGGRRGNRATATKGELARADLVPVAGRNPTKLQGERRLIPAEGPRISMGWIGFLLIQGGGRPSFQAGKVDLETACPVCSLATFTQFSSMSASGLLSLEVHFLVASLGVLRVPILLRAGRWGAFSAMRLTAQAAVRSLPGS